MPPPADSGVTTVVITRDRLTDLRSSLPRHEDPVILVDNGSTDGTVAYVRQQLPHIRVVELAENHGSVARNIGVELAATPYVAFADDDSWWAPGSLAAAARLLDTHPRLAVLAGRMLVGPEQRLDPVCLEMAGSPLGTSDDLPGPSVLGFLACGAVVRRSAFLAAGGFDDVIFFLGEEERLCLDLASAGWGIAYVDEVVAHHHPSPARDPRAREVLGVRNRILTTMMRRPWPVVAGTMVAAARSGAAGRGGVREALKRAPKALRRRRSVPDHVEAARRVLSAASG
jgi:GT2 family glycosyltransferase